MDNCIKTLMEEHSNLIIRIRSLEDYIYSEKSDNDDKIEFANKCIQISAMKKYEECLRARLENANVSFNGKNYYAKVAEIKDEAPKCNCGSDHDVDKQTTNE